MHPQFSRRGILYLIGTLATLAILATFALQLLLLGHGSVPPESFLAAFAPPSAPAQPSGSLSLHEQTPTSAQSTHEAPSYAPTPAPTPRPSSGGTTPAATATTPNGCAITPADLSGEQHLLGLLNAHRAAAGVRALNLDATLSAEARAHSCDMYLHAALSHTGSDGSTPFQRIHAAGVTYREAGENIGDTYGYALTVGLDLIDRNMMAEPLTHSNHHWNIVNAGYSRVGLGVIYQGGKLYFTEDFVG